MKKTFLTLISICAFIFSSAYAAEQASEVDAKEKSRRSAIEKVPACKNILSACRTAGFVAGGYKEGNGLWRNCFHPTLKGKAASLKGKDVTITVNAADVSSCKSVAKEHLKHSQTADNSGPDNKIASNVNEMKVKREARKAAKAEAAATSTAVNQ